MARCLRPSTKMHEISHHVKIQTVRAHQQRRCQEQRCDACRAPSHVGNVVSRSESSVNLMRKLSVIVSETGSASNLANAAPLRHPGH